MLLGNLIRKILIEEIINVVVGLFFLFQNVSYNQFDVPAIVVKYLSESATEKDISPFYDNGVLQLGGIRIDECFFLTVLHIDQFQSLFILLTVLVQYLGEQILIIGVIDEGLSEAMKSLINHKDDVIDHFAHFFAFIALIGGKRRF